MDAECADGKIVSSHLICPGFVDVVTMNQFSCPRLYLKLNIVNLGLEGYDNALHIDFFASHNEG